MTDDERFEEDFQQLILDGMVEPAGLTADGQMMYQFTDKAFEEIPNLAERATELFSETVNVLWEKGFVDMNIADPNPMVKLTEKALNEEARQELPYEERVTLEYIIETLKL